MSGRGQRASIDVEGNRLEVSALLVSPNRKSLLMDLLDQQIMFRDGSLLAGVLPLIGDGHGDDYTCLVNGAAVKVTWL